MGNPSLRLSEVLYYVNFRRCVINLIIAFNDADSLLTLYSVITLFGAFLNTTYLKILWKMECLLLFFSCKPYVITFTVSNQSTKNGQKFAYQSTRVRKRAMIRNRYNQAPHLTQDTFGKVTTSQLDITNESQKVNSNMKIRIGNFQTVHTISFWTTQFTEN